MKSIVDKQWQNNILIFNRVKQWLSFFKFNFPASVRKYRGFLMFHSEGYVCFIADGDKFIKTSRVLLQKHVYKTSSSFGKIQFTNLFWWKMKETNWDTLTFLLQKSNWNTSWWYPQWLSGVSSSFSVSPSVVHNCCRKCLLKW